LGFLTIYIVVRKNGGSVKVGDTQIILGILFNLSSLISSFFYEGGKGGVR